jgi:hypothetical protein
MKERKPIKSILKNLSPYFLVSCLSLLYTYLFFKLYRADLRVPFIYFGDTMFYGLLIKGIGEHGWYLNNTNIGMPYGAQLHDFPIPDTFNLLLMKLGTWFTDDHALILNLFFILTFPLVTITSFYVFRQFNLSFFPALLGSMLYTFTPYHLSRGESHLMYSAYYVVPLIVLVILWVCALSGRNDQEGRQEISFSLRNSKLIISIVICVLIASTGGVYYSFFACYLLLVIGLIQSVSLKSLRHLLLPGFLTAVIFATMVANLSPSIIYQLKNGKTDTAQRVPAESEIYGLKMAQLVLPLTGHRIGALRKLKDEYNTYPLVTENDDSTLGLVGSIGFITLLGLLLCKGLGVGRREEGSTNNLLTQLSVLNISAVLLATIGGLSALFNLLISPQVRAYNRISVYISFFALFTIVLLLERARRRFFQSRSLRVTFGMLVILATALGLLDQSARRFVPNYHTVKVEYQSDSDFIRMIEASVPARSMIFQLPVKRFPETAPIEQVWDYELLKGYLHSKELRWTYGAMRGRQSDFWQALVVAKPIPEMVESIALTDFEGIYIDRYGYRDRAAELENNLTTLLGVKPLVSKNGRLSFFNLSLYKQKLREKNSAQELSLKREKALYPVLTNWMNGFSGLEGEPGDEWRWCGPSGELVLHNTAPYARRVTVEMSLATQGESNLRIESPFFTEQLKTYSDPITFSKSFNVPPGQHKLKFVSDAQKIFPPNDHRVLVFRVINFKLISG